MYTIRQIDLFTTVDRHYGAGVPATFEFLDDGLISSQAVPSRSRPVSLRRAAVLSLIENKPAFAFAR